MFNKSLIIISLISIWGSIIYRFYALNNWGIFLTIVLVAISYIIAGQSQSSKLKLKNKCLDKFSFSKDIKYYILYIIFYILLFFCFYILFKSAIIKSIVSPWQVVPWYFFVIYFFITFLGLIIVNIKKNINKFLFFTPFFFLSFSIALIVYKINYGFDSFIHQATIGLIDKNGLVEPKPLYYLGQYSLELIVHKLSHISLFWVDKLLVPVLASIFLPIAVYKFLQQNIKDKSVIFLTILCLLAIPFSFFIVTTPQNLAYLFLALVVVLGLSQAPSIVLFLLSLASLVTQPIAGIPALLFVFAIFVFKFKGVKFDFLKYKKYIYTLLFALNIFILPFLFYIFESSNSPNSNADVSSSLVSFIPSVVIPNQSNVILNFVYFYAFNISFFIFILACIGLITVLRSKKVNKLYFIYFGFSLSLFISYFITTYLPFSFLIEYERTNYTDRIFIIASFFLLPFVILALQKIIYRIKVQNKLVKIIFAILGALLISASLYIRYPRIDHYFNSRGYSTGENDIKAVEWINNNANDNYIVLANQQVSAAALNRFGFKKYYKVNGAAREDGLGHKDDIFYYPVPTGGPLYQYYLDMVYKEPSRINIINAMNLAEVDIGYFVLNKYWWAFKKILDEAKLNANEWQEFGDGEVYVFKFLR